jgi:hypothetical protein
MATMRVLRWARDRTRRWWWLGTDRRWHPYRRARRPQPPPKLHIVPLGHAGPIVAPRPPQPAPKALPPPPPPIPIGVAQTVGNVLSAVTGLPGLGTAAVVLDNALAGQSAAAAGFASLPSAQQSAITRVTTGQGSGADYKSLNDAILSGAFGGSGTKTINVGGDDILVGGTAGRLSVALRAASDGGDLP